MAFSCRVECDSVSPDGVRLTTFVVEYPRIIHCEIMTHRMLSRNSASSRAVPVEKRIAAVEADPFVPEQFGKNQRGMQAREQLDEANAEAARSVWLLAVREAVASAKALAGLGVHKQLANRLLEPFSWHTAVITATDWKNFFALRCHPDAQPEFQKIAGMMLEAMAVSKPNLLGHGNWHLPFVDIDTMERADQDDEEHLDVWYDRLKLISAGRCARVSYETQDGRRDPAADIALAERLIAATPKHASPLEHQATPIVWPPPADAGGLHRGNFRGWRQFRHEVAAESIPG